MTIADSSDSRAHRATCLASEQTKQADIAKAIATGGGSAAVQKAISVAEVAHYNRISASALANGLNSAEFVQAAKWVGTQA